MTTFPIAKRVARNPSRLFTAGLLALGLAVSASGSMEGTAFAGQPDEGAQKGQNASNKHARHHGPRTPAAVIARFDANGDGKLAVSELPEKMRPRLSAADSNKDGVLSTEELKAHGEQHAKERFAKRDKNSDGALMATEVSPGAWEHLKVADSNNDARVTFAELQEARAAGKLKGARHGHKQGHRDATKS